MPRTRMAAGAGICSERLDSLPYRIGTNPRPELGAQSNSGRLCPRRATQRTTIALDLDPSLLFKAVSHSLVSTQDS